ncbi:MAG: hypothetical protein K0U37_07780 [Gammaproteobacteria bacterium]|nr:hypothetical protein [Gammaproteobacteria bacterium]
MITPAVVLLVASYAAPTTAPNGDIESRKALQEKNRIESNHREYNTTSETEMKNKNSEPEDTMTQSERAGKGRMVVPKNLR